MNDFTHLHLHTHFSFLDAMNRIPDLMEAVKAHGQRAVAVTEHGNLCSALQFYKTAKKHGVKPILGCEIYVTPGSRRDRTGGQKHNHHLVLLAENEIGFKNLIRLVNGAHLEGFYYRPRVDHELLERYNEGLIVSSACLSGEVASAILDHRIDEAEKIADWYASVFKGRYYLEIQENGIEDQKLVNEAIVKMASRMNLPLVATNDCHYLTQADAVPHDILLCVDTKKTVHEQKRKRYGSDAFYLRSTREMADLFYDRPQAIKSTSEIAERCNLEIEFGKFLFPGFDVARGETLESTLAQMSRGGLERRLSIAGPAPEMAPRLYEDRLAEEIELISGRGFAGYLLIVQDFMNWARREGIPVGPGRGSAAGSLVCYALGITDIDPLRYGLLFERFMNPERRDNPDIDCDFCGEKRDRVIEYVTGKYGVDNVSQIGSYATMKAKAVVRDIGRALGFPLADVDRVAKMIPGDLDVDLTNALERNPDLRDYLENNAWARELWDVARSLEGLSRHIGKHAAGVVIAPEPLFDLVPLTRDKDGRIITQWDKRGVEEIGLIKFDFLGLITLTIIDKAVKLIEATHGVKIDPETIPIDDTRTFELLGTGQTTGVFQLFSPPMRDLLRRLKPKSIHGIMALIALYRPGPMGLIPEYIDCANGRKEPHYALPILEPILKETYGIMVYQEQVMQVATAVGGLSLGESDLMRRAMSKKSAKDMETFRGKFLEGARARNISGETAKQIWDHLEKFADYGFNKSHSAAYAVVAYQTAYLKANYPIEFFAALMTVDSSSTDKLLPDVAEAREMDFEILPPDINRSKRDFYVENGNIRFGLAAIKGVGVATVDAIIAARERVGGFRGLLHMLEETEHQHINKGAVQSLIRAGCFDSLLPDRARLFAGVDVAFDRVNRILREKQTGQATLFGPSTSPSEAAGDRVLPEVAAWTDKERLENEKEALGFFLTGHPLQQYAKMIRKYASHTCADLREITGRQDATMGIVASIRKVHDTARGRMAVLDIEDLTGSMEAVVYAEPFARHEALIRGNDPILVKGRADSTEKGPKLYIDEAWPLAEADRLRGAEMHIRLPENGMTEGSASILRNILSAAERGKCRPLVHCRVPGVGIAVMRLPSQFHVSPTDEIVHRLQDLLGSDAVDFS